ncbi:MAG TPA: hypothetical protein VFY91_17130 [Microbacterium sp.]|nr:hypothetical protein [Microbacterium sp.]
MIGVVAERGRYRVAVAELPLSVSLSGDQAGAIVVVPGGGRWDAAVRAAARAGAAAIVVSRPGPIPAESIEDLAAEFASLPVVVERPFLRHDTIEDARSAAARAGDGAPPAVIAVDAVATASTFDLVLRDAVGWLRVLGGERPVLTTTAEGLSFFEGAPPGGAPAVLTAVRVPAGTDRIQAHVLGEVRSEIDTTATGGVVSTTTALGCTTSPRGHESLERIALRRAVAAIGSGVPTADLADLSTDTAIAAEIAAAVRGHKHH